MQRSVSMESADSGIMETASRILENNVAPANMQPLPLSSETSHHSAPFIPEYWKQPLP